MNAVSSVTGDQLAGALNLLGVQFIMGESSRDKALHKQPERLLSALAQSSEARLRLALIPLLLEHPEFSAYARTAADSLTPPARLTLQCYYTAAFCLQRILSAPGKPLPDLFSGDLNLNLGDHHEENLRALARRHRELSGAPVNWLGTYQHAAQIWQKNLEFKRA